MLPADTLAQVSSTEFAAMDSFFSSEILLSSSPPVHSILSEREVSIFLQLRENFRGNLLADAKFGDGNCTGAVHYNLEINPFGIDLNGTLQTLAAYQLTSEHDWYA